MFEELQTKFRCLVPRGSLYLYLNLGQQFGKYYISTDPDPEDFSDLFEKDGSLIFCSMGTKFCQYIPKIYIYQKEVIKAEQESNSIVSPSNICLVKDITEK